MTLFSDVASHWGVVDHLLDEALALPQDARGRWLDSLGTEHAAHRALLRQLLDARAAAGTDDFLADLPQLPGDEPADLDAEPQAGDVVGPYRLVREIGRGGMGLVWLAERDDARPQRAVALKLPQMAWGQGLSERLARERDILGRLEHAHIARLYDAGVDELGRPYLAMQFVEGEPIDDHCRRVGATTAQRIELLLQAAAAVAHAHARLVVHRDLKPANMLVDGDGQLMLLDFGIAKLMSGDRTEATALTRFAGRALTAQYASPEQIRGDPLGTASDVYSLGVVAYELLSGARPYQLTRGTAAELEEAIVLADPPRASDAATVPAAKRALRGDVDAILATALRKSPDARYASVDAFARDLRRHLDGEPVEARPDGAGYRFAKFIGRHRAGVAMGMAAAVSVLVGTAAALWQASEARRQEQRATQELSRQRATEDLYIETLSRLSVLAAEQPEALGRPGAVTSVLVDKLREFAPRTAQRPDQRAAQLQAVMLQLNYDNRFEDSLAVGQEYLAHLKRHDAPAAQVINAYTSLGRTLFQLQRYDDSLAMRRAGAGWAPDVHDSDTEVARMLIGADLGGLLTTLGRRGEAFAVLTRADRAAERYFRADHLRHVTLLGLAKYWAGFDDVQRLHLVEMAYADLQANGTADPDDTAKVQWQLGEALLANGRTQEAERMLDASLEIMQREYGRDSRNALHAFGRSVGATARLDPRRAQTRIADESATLAALPGGRSSTADGILLARTLQTAWLAGDAAGARPIALPDRSMTLRAAALRENQFLILQVAHVLEQGGRASEALGWLETLRAGWPAGSTLTTSSLDIDLSLAGAQLAAGQVLPARRTADHLLAALRADTSTSGPTYRQALAISALASAMAGDGEAARAALAELARRPVPPFASAAELADCELLRSQALADMGQGAEARRIATSLLPGLAGQAPSSPRLALARRLARQAG